VGTAQALELFAPQQSNLILETSTCPVDPGEDHEKVKALYDIVIRDAPPSNSAGTGDIVQGLRTVVGRGSSLDVGLCHSAAERSRLTVELWVKFDPASVRTNAIAPENMVHRLVMRCKGGPARSEAGEGLFPDDTAEELAKFNAVTKDVLWTFFIDQEGRLCWSFGLSTVRTSTRCSALMDSAQWVHVACTADGATGRDGNSAGWAASSLVTIFVNGEVVASENLALPSNTAISDIDLAVTTLYVAPNLCSGWSLTEFRVWADARSASDIDNTKENHLALASKRKRLQSRIKGGKKMFSPLVASSLVIGNEATDLTPLVAVLKKITGKDEDDEPQSTASGAATGGPSGPAAGGLKGPAIAGKLGGPGLSLGASAAGGAAATRRASLLGKPGTLAPSTAPSAAASEASKEEKLAVPVATSEVAVVTGNDKAEAVSTDVEPPIGKAAGVGGGLLAGPGAASSMSAAARARRTSAAATVSAPTASVTTGEAKAITETSSASSLTPFSSSAKPAVPAVNKSSDTNGSTGGDVLAVIHRLSEPLSNLAHASIYVHTLLQQANTKPFQNFGAIVCVVRDHNSAPSNNSTNVFVHCANTCDSLIVAPLHHENITLELPTAVESVVINNVAVASVSDVVVAVMARNVITVLACSNRCLTTAPGSASTEDRLFRPIAVQSATPVCYWAFVGADSIFVLGPKAAYSWKVRVRDEATGQLMTPTANANNKPNKLFERFDVLPSIGGGTR
jgi:hypothetical protein